MTERKGIIEKHYLSFYRYLCFIWLIINWFHCDRLDRPGRKPLMYRKALSINTKKHIASCKNTFGIVGIVKHLDFWLKKNWVISTHVRKNLNLFSVKWFLKIRPHEGRTFFISRDSRERTKFPLWSFCHNRYNWRNE